MRRVSGPDGWELGGSRERERERWNKYEIYKDNGSPGFHYQRGEEELRAGRKQE